MQEWRGNPWKGMLMVFIAYVVLLCSNERQAYVCWDCRHCSLILPWLRCTAQHCFEWCVLQRPAWHDMTGQGFTGLVHAAVCICHRVACCLQLTLALQASYRTDPLSLMFYLCDALFHLCHDISCCEAPGTSFLNH